MIAWKRRDVQDMWCEWVYEPRRGHRLHLTRRSWMTPWVQPSGRRLTSVACSKRMSEVVLMTGGQMDWPLCARCVGVVHNAVFPVRIVRKAVRVSSGGHTQGVVR